jgi:predicted site-specific integrase-resolvase
MARPSAYRQSRSLGSQLLAKDRTHRYLGVSMPAGPVMNRAIKVPASTVSVAIYVRRSTDDEHQPYSLDNQVTRLHAYITSQPGWVLVNTFSDDASGATTNRPGLQAALAAARGQAV